MNKLMNYKWEILSAFLFGVGLDISQMTDTQKVIGFLDISENWDPALAFVMLSAVIVHSLTYYIFRKNPNVKSIVDGQKRKIDKKLIFGSFLFGVGWGTTGFCPGPGLASLLRFEKEPYIMVFAMIIGMYAYKYVTSYLNKPITEKKNKNEWSAQTQSAKS